MTKREADILEIKELFLRCFGAGEDIERIYFAPGRINIIGEHIDYNGGFVMPCAINKGTYLAAAPNGKGALRLFSCSHQDTGVQVFSLEDRSGDGAWQKTGQWVDYPLGVFEMFRQEGYALDGGYDFLYCGDLPEGAGFSSSASIEMVTAMALNDLARPWRGAVQPEEGVSADIAGAPAFDRKELALLCCRAENQFVGVQCGAMDQLAVALGKKGNALLLDTATLEYQYVPVNMPDVRVVVVNTNKARNLTDGAYNEVRVRNETASRILGAADGGLCRISPEQANACREKLEENNVFSLVRHMLNENARTLHAKEAMEKGNLRFLGQLLKESHESLRDDLEVSCYELDVLAEEAGEIDGTLGARMMGGGFGGCVLALVKESAVRGFKRRITSAYTRKTDLMPIFYDDLAISDGGERIYVKTSSHPRPAMKRSSFTDLNGVWEYAITKSEQAPDEYQGTIRVPYSPEAKLSGVEKQVKPDEYLHYRLRHCLDEDTAEKLRKGAHRLYLHFGAVDQSCSVFVNGQKVGEHRGGYLPFGFDVTGAALAGKQAESHMEEQAEELDLKVAVKDISDTGYETIGKQKLQPGGMFYTAQSGVWQTVWMEVVPKEHIERVHIKPDVDGGCVWVTVDVAGAGDDGRKARTPHGSARITIAPRGEAAPWDTGALLTEEIPMGRRTALNIPEPVLWSPETPFLYDMKIETETDTVYSYFAMRKASMGKDAQGITRLMLNNKPYFVNGVLDQGYWPEGLYTAPDEDALYADIDRMKALGFNCLRKHVKVEPQIWYHHCDKTGMLVMQDMVNGGGTLNSMLVTWLPNIAPKLFRRMKDDKYKALRRDSEDSQKQYLEETREMIDTLGSFPCIIAWVPFNEGWGQFDSRAVTEFVRALDDTRLIDSASGWFDRGCGDFHSIHNYFFPLRIGPEDGRSGRIVALTEYGGSTLLLKDHFYGKKKYGYGGCKDKGELSGKYKAAFEKDVIANIPKGLCMSIYTQLSDIEDEINGIYTYDREILKFEEGVLKELNGKINALNAEAAELAGEPGSAAQADGPGEKPEPGMQAADGPGEKPEPGM